MFERIKSAYASLRNFFGTKALTGGRLGAARQAMGGGAPGGWATNHVEETRHYTGWNYVAIRAKALQAAQAECYVYQDEDHREAIKRKQKRLTCRRKGYNYDTTDADPLPPTHPLVRLLKRPNPSQSGASFNFERILQLSLTGSCFIWNVPNYFGLTVERYVIPTAYLQPVPPDNQYPNGGWRVHPNDLFKNNMGGWFPIGQLTGAVSFVVPVEEMQIIRWPHPMFKDDGCSPLSATAKWTDSAEMLDERRWNHMFQGPEPSFVVSVDSQTEMDESTMERAAKKLSKRVGGVSNAGQVMLVSSNSKVTPIGHTAREMAYVESFLQLRDTIMATHGTPPIAAGVSEGTAFAAVYASLKQFTIVTVQPELDMLADEDTEQLAPQFGPGLTIELEAQGVDDPQLEEQRNALDGAMGIRTLNEWRAMRGLPPDETPKGDEYISRGGAAEVSTVDGESEDEDAAMTASGESDEESTGVSSGRMLSHFGPQLRNGKAAAASQIWGGYP